MHRQSVIFILFLSFFCGSVQAAEQSSHLNSVSKSDPIVTSNVDSEEAFFGALSALETENQNAGVEGNFKKFIADPDKYLNLMSKKYLFRTEHSPSWLNNFCVAAEFAKKRDWKASEKAATEGLKYKPEEPALIFLRAVAFKELNSNALSLVELKRLYVAKSKKEFPKDWNKFYEPDEREFFNFLML